MSNIRADFPFLDRKYAGKQLAYLDNASTTQKPGVVISAVVDAYKNHYANVHRGVYGLSQEATELYESVREKTTKFIGAKSSREVIFTKNTTESLNLLAYTLGQRLNGGDEILISDMEHHSNIVPWQMLVERLATNGKRVKIKYIPINRQGELDLSNLDKLVTRKTKILSLTLMSNVLGTINPVSKIIRVAKKKAPALIAIVDAAQASAHMKIDIAALSCDFLAFSAHKMYGPSGVGLLWGKAKLLYDLPPFLGGGDMILSVTREKATFNELPWKFEAGTPNIADVIAFGPAIEFVQKVGFARISKNEMDLTKYAVERLAGDPLVEIYGPGNRGPVISFNIDGVHPHDVASILSDFAVAIRSGHHCAQPLMDAIGIPAACRVSFGVYNIKEDVDRFIAGLRKVKEVFKLNQKSKIRILNRGSSRLRLDRNNHRTNEMSRKAQ